MTEKLWKQGILSFLLCWAVLTGLPAPPGQGWRGWITWPCPEVARIINTFYFCQDLGSVLQQILCHPKRWFWNEKEETNERYKFKTAGFFWCFYVIHTSLSPELSGTHNKAESSECSPQSSDTVLLQLLRKFLFLDALWQQQSKKTDAPEKSQSEFMKLFYAVQTQVYLMSLILNDLWNSTSDLSQTDSNWQA